MLHMLFHVLVPLLAAQILRPDDRWRAFGLMMLAMLIDLDHLLATPIYDPQRCSIGFHPLHSLVPVLVYLALLGHPKTRLVGIGLCIHILLDSIDCRINTGMWISQLT
ncbi:MAG: DUF6122 family protein [Pseudomonadota bacterium]